MYKKSIGNLALDHIRITYKERKYYFSKPSHNWESFKVYLQLEHSYYWHFLHLVPTFYARNEKKLDNEIQKLEQIINFRTKVPKVSVRLSKKAKLFQPSTVLYTIDLDFGEVYPC